MNWNLITVLMEPAKLVLGQIGQFLINILLVIIILIIGWVASRIIKTLITSVLRKAKLDELSVRIELDNILAKGGIKYSLSELLGVVSYWLGILVTFVVALSAVNLITTVLLDKIVSYIPNIIAAIFIIIVGMFTASLLKNIIQAAALNAGISHASFLAKVAEVIVVVFALLMILEQLGIGVRVSEITLAIILGSIGLGAALAFGLGCKEIAGKYIENLVEKINKK